MSNNSNSCALIPGIPDEFVDLSLVLENVPNSSPWSIESIIAQSANSILFQLGLLESACLGDLQSKRIDPPDVCNARQILKFLEMLQEKTAGNLSEYGRSLLNLAVRICREQYDRICLQPDVNIANRMWNPTEEERAGDPFNPNNYPEGSLLYAAAVRANDIANSFSLRHRSAEEMPDDWELFFEERSESFKRLPMFERSHSMIQELKQIRLCIKDNMTIQEEQLFDQIFMSIPVWLEEAKRLPLVQKFREKVETDWLATEDFQIVKVLKNGPDFWSTPQHRNILNQIVYFYSGLADFWTVESSVDTFDKTLGETLKYAGDACLQLYDFDHVRKTKPGKTSVDSDAFEIDLLDDAYIAFHAFSTITAARQKRFPDDLDTMRNRALSVLRSTQLFLRNESEKLLECVSPAERYAKMIPGLVHAFNLFETAAARQPGNLKAQRNVSVACLILGDVYRKLGNEPSAADYFDRCRRIRQEILAVLPENPQAQKAWKEILTR